MLQIVRSKDCDFCNDKCCRFAVHLARFSPIFTVEEYNKVIKNGYGKNMFDKLDKNTYQVKLDKKENGFFICPFLKEEKWCSIYEFGPYDCKIWPFILMRNKEKDKIYLMMDKVNNCPSIKKASTEKRKKYIKYLKKYLNDEKTIKLLKKYPKMISDYDYDLTKICFMEDLTKKIL